MPILTAFGGTSGRQFMFGGGALGPPTEVSFLVIAGGGGAGTGGNNWGSGGGAGGYRSSWNGETSGGGAAAESAFPISVGTSYTVTVGAGGAYGPDSGTQGSSSVFDTITTVGGGYGRGYGNGVGGPGGSGGGAHAGDGPVSARAGGTGTASQGYPGGTALGTGGPGGTNASGGGGAGSAGTDSSWNYAGNAGAGAPSTITGSDVTRAKGTAGTFAASVAPDGANSGGGGSQGYPANPYAGDSGVVILRFTGQSPTVGAGLTYSETTVGGDTVLTFTAGTDTISW